MRSQTAIGAKMAAKGILAHNVKFQLAIAAFQNNGGEYGVALAMLNAAYGRGSQGRMDGAEEAIVSLPASPTNAAKGRHRDAEQANKRLPDAAHKRDGAGRTMTADKAGGRLPASVSRNKPGHAKRGAIAIASVQATVAKSLFDSTTLPDGRRLREVRWSECPGLATKYRRLSRVFMAVHNVAVPADPNTTIDNLVTEDGLKDIISAVERFNDIH